MGESFLVKKMSDSVTDSFAFIGVTCTAGSTLTCTGNGKTWTADTSEGAWVFNIPNAGEYTVTCIIGASTNQEIVIITENDEGALIDLEFPIFLYNNGNLCEMVSGGWQGKALKAVSDNNPARAPTVTNTAEYLEMAIPVAVGEGICEILNNIELTKYSQIKITYKTYQLTNRATAFLCVGIRDQANWQSNALATVKMANNEDEYTSVVLDVSEIEGDQNVFIGYRNLYSINEIRYIYIKEVALISKVGTLVLYQYGTDNVGLTYLDTLGEQFSMVKDTYYISCSKGTTAIKASGFLSVPVDVTHYNKLTVKFIPANAGTQHYYLAINTTNAPDYNTDPTLMVQLTQSTKVWTTESLDISSYTGIYYVGIFAKAYSTANAPCKILTLKLT